MTVALVLGAMYTSANAVEMKPYIGLDASYSNAEFKNYFLNEEDSIDSKKDNNFNAGLNAGLQFNLNEKFYLGAEAYLNTGKLVDKKKSVYDTTVSYIDGYTDQIKLNQFFGVRFNAGYNFNKAFSVFGFIGLNYTNYEGKYLYQDESVSDYFSGKYTEDVLTPSFGLGVAYNFTENFQMNLSYEFSKFNIKDDVLAKYQDFNYFDINKKVDMTINTVKLGVKYLF